VDPGKVGFPFAVEGDGVGPPGGVDDDGMATWSTFDCHIQAPGAFDQTKSLNWGLRRDRSGNFHKLGCKQSDSPNDQGDQTSYKTDDPRAFQWFGWQAPEGAAYRTETENLSATSAAENALGGGLGAPVAQPTTAGAAAVVRLVRGMNGTVAAGKHFLPTLPGSAVERDYTLEAGKLGRQAAGMLGREKVTRKAATKRHEKGNKKIVTFSFI